MNNEEQILFEEYFQIIGYKGQEIEEKYLHLIINILLSSEELENHELLTLNIKANTQDLDNFSIYTTYYDKQTLENKDMTGTIIIKNNKIYLIGNTYNFTSHRNIELREKFKKTKDIITRYRINSAINNNIKKISKEEFEKSERYIKDLLTEMNRRRK